MLMIRRAERYSDVGCCLWATLGVSVAVMDAGSVYVRRILLVRRRVGFSGLGGLPGAVEL
jgi:hypothetical protein